MSDRYEVACEVAREAGRLAHVFFLERASLVTEHKGAQDFVSRADRAVEELIAARMAHAFPADAFLGEESAARFGGDADRAWVVDPIDGTTNFLRGARYYCISIAFRDKGRTSIGVVYDPEHAELFRAQRGEGAWCDDANGAHRLAASSVTDLGASLVCVGHHDRAPEPRYLELRAALMEHGVAVRNMGAGALQLAHVAAGRYEAFVELSLNAWDALAGLLLIEEAGGYAAPFPGPKGLTAPAPVMGCAAGIARELSRVAGFPDPIKASKSE